MSYLIKENTIPDCILYYFKINNLHELSNLCDIEYCTEHDQVPLTIENIKHFIDFKKKYVLSFLHEKITCGEYKLNSIDDKLTMELYYKYIEDPTLDVIYKVIENINEIIDLYN